MNKRIIILLYGVLAYVVGIVGLGWFLLYVGGWDFLPRHVNSGSADDWMPGVLVNVALMVLFAAQHSVMARPWCKRRMEKVMPPAAERSNYVLCSGLLLMAFCLFWQAVPGLVWSASSPWLVVPLRLVHVAGWLVMIGATFEIDHLELTGLKQVWTHFKGEAWRDVPFSEKCLYRIVRHPIQLGLLMVLWANPQMSKTLYLLAAMLTVYIHIGLHFEERALVAEFGETYRDYMRRVPRLLPLGKLLSGRGE